MKELHKLKENLISELSDYAKGGLNASTLDTIDKLAHAAKNVSKVIECCEDEGYSNYGGYSRRDGFENYVRPDGSYRDGGMSYARGRGAGAKRDAMGRYSRDGGMSYARGRGPRAARDSMGRYSSDGGVDEHTKEELMKLIEKM